jgi:hypothetical protein
VPRSVSWAIIMGTEPHRKGETPFARRTEKQWRHEDRELTSTHVLWNAAITANTVIVAASGIFVANDKFPLAPVLFPYVFSVSAAAILGVILLAYLLRSSDRISGVYFRTVSQQSELPIGFDKGKEEQERQNAEKRYNFWRGILEGTEALLLIANLAMFYIIVTRHN